MSSESTNLGLVIWDSNDDEFNPDELADNWRKIDEAIVLPRSTDRVQALATLPGGLTVSEDGLLVYLTAADSGFPAKTLVRWDGSAWRAVGPFEILSALPTSGNYAGRMVLLSAATTTPPFDAWTLVVWVGPGASDWQKVVRFNTYIAGGDLASYAAEAGEVLVLSSSTTFDGKDFASGDVIRYHGGTWDRVGPQRWPDETTTVLSLTGVEGQEVFLTTGTSPNDHYIPAYYSTVATGWVVPGETHIGNLVSTASTTVASATITTSFPTVYVPWQAFDDADLTPEVRLLGEFSISNSSGTTSVAIGVKTADRDGAPSSFSEVSNSTKTVSGTTAARHFDTGWRAVTGTVTDSLAFGVYLWSSSTSYTATLSAASLRIRWVEQ